MIARPPAPSPPEPSSLVGRPAGFVSRLLALAVDVGVLALTIMVGNLLLTALRIAGPIPWIIGRLARVYPWIGPWLVDAGALLSLGLAFVTVIGYFLFFFAITGQTLGKRLLGIQVVTAAGGRLTLWQSGLRLAAYLASIAPLYLGFLAALVDERGRAWHDRIAGTLVVYAWDARPDERFLRAPAEGQQSAGRRRPYQRQE
jgi:uncharacterized RDD family membrane protein YckC